MDNTKYLAENPRKEMGYIKIYNKSYPIYEGLNVIGRDLKATVRMTDLKFSKQHAVLSVVDETTHLISDFGSSNGTELRRNKLMPFKFYKINDREPIIFGDVVGVYHMDIDSKQKDADKNATESQIPDHISSTQLMTENIHDLPTQLFDKDTTQNIHEVGTQEINKIASNVHDLNTQVLAEVPECSKSAEILTFNNKDKTQISLEVATQEINKTASNVHDLNKQVLPEVTECSKSAEIITIDDDFGLSRTETYDDVFANDSFRLSLQTNSSKYDIVVDETLPTDTKLDNSVTNKNNISIDDDDIILNTQDNENIEKQTLEFLKTNKKEEKYVKNKDDSDSETDIEDEEFKKQIHEKSTQLNNSKDKNESTKKIAEENKHNDSDSETDAEDDILSKKTNKEPTDSGSDTDIEDNVLANLPSCVNNESSTKIEDVKSPSSNKSKPTTIIFSDEEEEIDLLAPTQKLQNVEFLVPTQLLQTKSENKDADDDLRATQLLQSKNTANKIQELDDNDFLVPTQLLQNQDDDLLLVPTQLLESKKSENIQNETQENDIDLLAPTQLLERRENKEQVHDENDDDDLAPTQLLQSKTIKRKEPVIDDVSDMLAPTQLLERKENKEQVYDENDDDDLAPTQLLQSKTNKRIEPEIDDASDMLAPTQLLERKENKEQVHDENDDDDLAPTQLLQSKTNKRKESETDDDSDMLAPTQLLQSKRNDNNKEHVQDEINDDDLPPTQLLKSNSNKNKEQEIDDDDLAPTQLLQNKNLNDDTFSAPTQILEQNKSIFEAPTEILEQNKSIFEAPTQMLEKNTTSIFSPPKKSSILSTKSPRNKEKRSVNFSEDAIYDMPTQKLDKISVQNKDNDIFTAPTKLIEKNENLNNTDDIYSAETQQLQKNISAQDPNDSCSSSISGINNLNNTQESVENLSLKLVLSETEESICESSNKNLNNFKTTLSKALPESETQLEVDFALETQKLYVEEKTSRPDNPLAHMFAEEQTQMTEEIIETKSTYKKVVMNEKTVDIETSRRLKIQLEDITQASTSKTHSPTCDENDFKQEPLKRGRKKKNIVDTVTQNAPKLNITRVKNLEDTKNNNTKLQKKDENDSLIKSSETNEETKPHNTRGNRISYQKLNSEGKKTKTETKKPPSRGRPSKNSLNIKETEVVSSLSERRQTRDKLKTPKKETKEIEINDNSSDMDDFINRVTRSSKRTHSVASTPKKKPKQEEENLDIEDSDDEMRTSVKKKVLKLQYTDDSEITASNSNSSNSAIVRTTKQSKRIMKIEEYSSDENESSHVTSICLNTPNTKRRRLEPLNVTVSSTQVSEEPLKHKVVFTMLNDTDLEVSVKKLGGSIIDSVHSCTVLVTNKITRSLKFLVAVALGKPIVQSTWITDSMKKKSFQDPWNYLLEDKESESKFKFSLKESLKKSVEKKLLTDVVILLATKKNTDVLKEIIETSGGKCIQRAPAKNGEAIVVSYEEEKAKYTKYLKQKTLTVVSAEAIFSGVLQQKLQWKQHLLLN